MNDDISPPDPQVLSFLDGGAVASESDATVEVLINAGCLRPLKIIIPDSSMLNLKYPAGVMAGKFSGRIPGDGGYG
jgi:N-methylhydantoinase B/oxoprolinase/acetone carboxylase alpha subunit